MIEVCNNSKFIIEYLYDSYQKLRPIMHSVIIKVKQLNVRK